MGQEWWEWRYKSGHWEDLNALLEFAHYSVIAGYLRCSITSGIVLDVGCGRAFFSTIYTRVYYAESPVQLVDRHSEFLSPRGVFVISMYEGSEPDPAHEERVQDIWGATASPPWIVRDEVHASSPAASVSWQVRLLGRRDRQSLSEMNEVSKPHETRRIAGHSR